MNKEIIKTLQDIGLSKEEVNIYLAGLELGESAVQDIAKKAGIKRPTAYLIIDNLIKKSLFYQTFKGKKRLFGAQNPKDLEVELKRKAHELTKIMPELNSIYNTLEFKPKVRFYEGVAGTMAVYNDMLDLTPENGEMLSFAGMKNLFDTLPKEFATDYFTRRIKKNIKPKIIAIDTEESREWVKNAEEEMREIILIPENQSNFSGDIEIYGDRVALISYKENFMTIVIESKEIANMQRLMFNLIWNNLKNQEQAKTL